MSSYALDPKYDGSKVIYINSADATNYIQTNEFGKQLTTNFLFNLKEKLVVNEDQLALISLYNATIPHSFYNVRAGVNDKITLEITWKTFDATPTTHTDNYVIQLDDGNYNTDDLRRRIIFGNEPFDPSQVRFPPTQYQGWNDLTFTAGTAGGLPLAGKKISGTTALQIFYEPVANVFLFQLVALSNTLVDEVSVKFNWATNPTIGFDTTNSTLELANAMLGFNGKEDFPNSPTQVSPNQNVWGVGLARSPPRTTLPEKCILQSQQVIDLNDNIHGLMLRTNLVSKSTMSSNTSVFSNILARIPITSLLAGKDKSSDPTDGHSTTAKSGVGIQGGVIYFNPSEATHQCLVDLKAIDTMGVRLTDDIDNTIDLNGLNFQFALLIQYVEKQPQFNFAPSRQNIDNAINQNIADNNKSLKIKNGKSKSKK